MIYATISHVNFYLLYLWRLTFYDSITDFFMYDTSYSRVKLTKKKSNLSHELIHFVFVYSETDIQTISFKFESEEDKITLPT